MHTQPQSDTSAQPHNPESYIPWWNGLAAAARAALTLAPLAELPTQIVDVVVIGGGVAGLSAALSARVAGANVLLLEREAMLGYGATGRNAGILSAGVNMSINDLPSDDPAASLWPETTQVLLSLVAEAAQPGSLLAARLTGSLSLAESKNAARKLAREAEGRVAAGLHAELWTPAQVVKATEGRLNVQAVIQAIWLPDEGRIHPLTLLAHLAQQARAAGVLIAGYTQVTNYLEVVESSSHYWQLMLADGTSIKARGLISAVGPTAQPNARIYAVAFASDLPDTFPLFWDASPYTYADFRPGDGRLTVSGGRYGRTGVTNNDASYHKRLANAARRWLPELVGTQPIATWGVDLAVAADMVPTLRVVGKLAPGVAIEGLGALGVLPGIVLGRRAGVSIVKQVG